MQRTVGSAITVTLLLSLGFLPNPGADDPQRLRKPVADTDTSYTTVGKIGLTVSNFGTVGSRNAYWPDQPSCEYPIGSRIEHIYQGGLWVGAVSDTSGQEHVSTGSSDQVSFTPRRDFEFTSELASNIIRRSSLSTSQYYDGAAVSHQDFIALYSDMNRTNPTTGDTIIEHVPLGLTVRQESYAWNFPFADYFVILNYTIYNTGRDTLDSVYVGFWYNGCVRNTNNIRPGTPGYFNHGANGYMDSLRMMYTFDFDGLPSPPPADSYVGVKLLGAEPFPHGVDSVGNMLHRAYFNAWRYRSSSGAIDFFSPVDDAANVGGARSKYDRMTASMPQGSIDLLRTQADNVTTLLSTGPFRQMLPGDSLNVVFGIVCARKYGTGLASLDTRQQRKTLITNASFLQKSYQGEDVNGNNILDPGEDLNGNGKLDHYQLPQPPRAPKVRVEAGNQAITLYWDKSSAELTVDPVTGLMDFEGYRVYRSNAGEDFTNPSEYLLNLKLAGEFDLAGDGVGNETGFSAIALSQPRLFSGDTVAYWYRFPPAGSSVKHLNGWQYIYGVSAFDRGDSATGITSLESKIEITRAIPGTVPPASGASKAVGVYPNPYYAGAVWDGAGERSRKIYFYNLPRLCEIRVYTLAGDVVAEIQHDATTYTGSDIGWFGQFGNSQTTPVFAGGEHAWDLITKYDQAIATGLYLFSVQNKETGETLRGKFLVIK